jgi:hypothetical protein
MSSIIAPWRRALLLLLVGCLVAALAGAVTNAAVAGKATPSLPTPTKIVVTQVTSDFTRGADFPGGALPSLVVAAGGQITIKVRFEDALGNAAAFKKDTPLTVTSNTGTVGTTAGTALKGSSTATVVTRVTDPINQVVLSVHAGTGSTAPSPGPTNTFDVLSVVKPNVTASNGGAFEEGIGGGSSCATAEPSAPVCGIVRLPRGSGANVLLSVGACDPDPDPDALYAPCYAGPHGPGGAVVQSLFTQPTDRYRIDSPATLIIKCDKTLCGTGSIQALTVLYSLGGNQPLTAPLACPAKGVMAEAGKPCVDYVQSKRDGSGDTHLFLLTDRDIRTGIG